MVTAYCTKTDAQIFCQLLRVRMGIPEVHYIPASRGYTQQYSALEILSMTRVHGYSLQEPIAQTDAAR